MDASDCQGCCNGNMETEAGNRCMMEKHDTVYCQDFQPHTKSKDPAVSPDHLKHSVPDGNLARLSNMNIYNGDKRHSANEPMPHQYWSLATLPPELTLVIFSYLEARFALRVLACVCKLFHNLLSPESSWKTRFSKRWPRRNNREDYDFVSSWKRICLQQEDLDKFWHDPASSLDFYQLKDQHFAAVDTVHIMNSADLCISGARDRAVGVWSLSALADPLEEGYAKKSFKQSLDGHRGWVWCLGSDPTGAPRVCSGSWDHKIKLWDLQGQSAEMTTISAHKAAVLCLSWEKDMLISGSYDRTIVMWDLRAGNSISSLKNHSKPVLCLTVDDRFIISGSEDQKLSVYDRRAARVYKSIKLKTPVFSLCQSSTCGYNYLRVGGRDGRLHVLDTTADRFEEITPSIELGQESNGKISGICHYGGAVVACSTDKSIKVLEPSRVLSVIHTFDCHTGEVTAVNSAGSVLASCSSDLTIGIWRPKSLRPVVTI